MDSRAAEAIKRLDGLYPGPGMLEIGEDWQMLMLIVLSARTTDEQVLRLAPRLFARFPNLKALASADVADVAATINTIGLFGQKAKALVGIARILLDRFDGRVPRDLDDLLTLPGVGQKTANVMRAARFHIPAIAVDTHVLRISNRLGLTGSEQPDVVMKELESQLPEELWATVNRVGVPFGREICQPRVPRCAACPIRDLCTYPHKTDRL